MALPGFYEDYLNMDNTLGLPHDSADGYMYDFAVNLLELRYLQITNSLTQEAQEKAISYMQSSECESVKHIALGSGFFNVCNIFSFGTTVCVYAR